MSWAIAVQIPTHCLDFSIPEFRIQVLFPLKLFTGCTEKKSYRNWWRSVFLKDMSSRWRWLSELGRWDSPLERYGAGWEKWASLYFQGAAKILKSIQRNYMCRVVFFQLCQVNARREVAVIYSPGFSDPSPLPVAIPSAAHNFTRFFRGKEIKIHNKAAQSLFFLASYCTDISTQVFINHFIFCSSRILFQIRSLSIIALLFSKFSALTTFCF